LHIGRNGNQASASSTMVFQEKLREGNHTRGRGRSILRIDLENAQNVFE